MRYIKRCLATMIALAVVAVALTGCTTTSVQQSKEKQRSSREPVVTEGLKKEGTLSVGLRTSSTTPFVAESGDAVSGLDVDLARTLADQLGLDVSFERVTDVKDALDKNCDIVLNVSTDEANGFDVVGDYAESALSFFRAGEPTVVSVEDIKGKRIALQDGSSAQRALRLTNLEATEVPCSTLNEAFAALESSKADYVLCNSCTGEYLATTREGIGFAGALNDPKIQGIALASGDGEVQSAVKKAYEDISSNGILAETRRTWIGSAPALTKDSVIKDIPMKETEGASLENVDDTAEVLSTALDGSTAGANAVSMSEAEAMGASSSKNTTTTESTSSTTTQNYNTYDYDYYYDDSYTTTQTTNGTSNSGSTGYTESDDYSGYSDYSETSGNADYSDYGATTDYGTYGNYTETYGY